MTPRIVGALLDSKFGWPSAARQIITIVKTTIITIIIVIIKK